MSDNYTKNRGQALEAFKKFAHRVVRGYIWPSSINVIDLAAEHDSAKPSKAKKKAMPFLYFEDGYPAHEYACLMADKNSEDPTSQILGFFGSTHKDGSKIPANSGDIVLVQTSKLQKHHKRRSEAYPLEHEIYSYQIFRMTDAPLKEILGDSAKIVGVMTAQSEPVKDLYYQSRSVKSQAPTVRTRHIKPV